MRKTPYVLFVHHLPVIGGATQSLLGLVKSYQKAGGKCKVLFLRKEGNAIEAFRNEGIDVLVTDTIFSYAHAYGAYNSFISRRPWRVVTNFLKSINSRKAATALIQSEKPDVLYLNTSVLIPIALSGKQLSIPVVWHLREQIHKGIIGIRKRIVQYLFEKYADVILSISEENKIALGLERAIVVYNSVNLDIFTSELSGESFREKWNIPSNTCVFLYLGGSVHSKGADLLVRSLPNLEQANRDYRVVLAGKIERSSIGKMNKVEHTINQVMQATPNLNAKTVFTGTLNAAEVAQAMAAADVLVWPAVVPHFARPIMEAMVMGKAILASDFASSKELVTDKNGILIKPETNALSDAMRFFVENRTLAKTMGQYSVHFGRAHFNAKVNNKRIIDIIQSQLVPNG